MSREPILRSYNDTKPSNNKDFELFYNTLSIGWHLRKVMELAPDLVSGDVEYDRLILWLTRHKVLQQKKPKVKKK